jgi:hypothetical protein
MNTAYKDTIKISSNKFFKNVQFGQAVQAAVKLQQIIKAY